MPARRHRPSSPAVPLALVALALVAGGSTGDALAGRDRPLPRRLTAAPVPAAQGAGLARAVFGVG